MFSEEELKEAFKRALANTIVCLVNDIKIRGLDMAFYLEDAIALERDQSLTYDELAARYNLVELCRRLVQFDFEKVTSLFPFYTYDDGRNTSVFPAWYYVKCGGNIDVPEIVKIISPSLMHPFYEFLSLEGYYAPDVYRALNGL